MNYSQPEYIRSDSRGTLTQVITNTFSQLNVLNIKKDFTFGGHYHKNKREVFYLVSGLVKLNVNNMVSYFSAGSVMTIEPYDKHTLTALEESVIVEALTKPYDREDIYE